MSCTSRKKEPHSLGGGGVAHHGNNLDSWVQVSLKESTEAETNRLNMKDLQKMTETFVSEVWMDKETTPRDQHVQAAAEDPRPRSTLTPARSGGRRSKRRNRRRSWLSDTNIQVMQDHGHCNHLQSHHIYVCCFFYFTVSILYFFSISPTIILHHYLVTGSDVTNPPHYKRWRARIIFKGKQSASYAFRLGLHKVD